MANGYPLKNDDKIRIMQLAVKERIAFGDTVEIYKIMVATIINYQIEGKEVPSSV